MFGNGQLVDYFRSWFTASDGRILFRHKATGAAYEISESEREEFIEIYSKYSMRSAQLLALFIAFGMIGSVGLLVFAFGDASVPLVFASVLMVSGAGLLIYLAILRRAATEIQNRLNSRTPVAGPLTREERTRWKLARISYANLAWTPVFALLLLFPMHNAYDPMHGSGRLVWIPIVGLVALAGVQAMRKYLAERDG